MYVQYTYVTSIVLSWTHDSIFEGSPMSLGIRWLPLVLEFIKVALFLEFRKDWLFASLLILHSFSSS